MLMSFGTLAPLQPAKSVQPQVESKPRKAKEEQEATRKPTPHVESGKSNRQTVGMPTFVEEVAVALEHGFVELDSTSRGARVSRPALHETANAAASSGRKQPTPQQQAEGKHG
jgi:hypothetical protein